MRLYVICKGCSNKIYLNIAAQNRKELAGKIGYNFTIKCNSCSVTRSYDVNEVFAESGSSVAGGAVIGGLIGLIGGPLGMIIGGVIGGALGNTADEQDRRQVNQFNEVLYD